MTTLDIPYLKIIEQAQQAPDAIAVLQNSQILTYAQLDRRSTQVAHYLRSQGVEPNSRVGIMTQRGPLMVIGILGILKAGGAYVPLDPDYPAERIRYILDHAEIQILLSEQEVAAALSTCLVPPLSLQQLLFLDIGTPLELAGAIAQIFPEIWSESADTGPAIEPNPDDLMTVLYTSGSTGRPKGVMLSHRGYMNRLDWMQKTFQLRPGDRVAQKTSFCFDISVWELFWTLMEGASICPVAREIVLNPWEFARWMQTQRIQVMHFVPSLFGEFINALANQSWRFPDLRWLIFSGEALPADFIRQWIDRHGLKTGLANLYGPTEASIDVTAHLIESRPERSIPIGKAIDNVYIRILDAQMQPVPPGELGELWIGGVQLAKGYLKDPERTASTFQPNPFADIPGETLYRSGDLAKELPDGNFEYHGRIDHQVKIRGFRVELGEIENALILHPAVQEAAVLAMDYEAGQKRLVAWLAGQTIAARELKQFLAEKLPHYMIPQRIEWLPGLPKNHNGKLDRKALLAPQPVAPQPVIADAPSAATSFPLAPAQRWIVTYFDPPYQWAGCSRFRYQKALDMGRFSLAFNQVIARHSALRMVFEMQDGQWRQQLLQPPPLEIALCDGSCFAPEDRDRYVEFKIQQTLQQLRLDRWPLFALVVVKVHETCYDITLVAHHMIADLLAGSVLFRDLWQTYDRLLSEGPAPDGTVSANYLSYIQRLQTAEQQGELNSHIDYWQAQFPSEASAFQPPFDYVKGANIEASTASEQIQLTPAETNRLLQDAKQRYRCNVYWLLLAPLYQLLADWSKKEWIVVSHRSHGRDLGQGQVFWQSFGNFAVNFPVGLKVGSGDHWQTLVAQIGQQFAGLPMNGVTYDWVGERLPDHLYPDEKLTPVRANYLGNRSLPGSEVFEFIQADRDRRLALPEQKRTTLLEFFFSISEGVMELEIEYSRNFYRADTIQQLARQYVDQMRNLLLKSIKSASSP